MGSRKQDWHGERTGNVCTTPGQPCPIASVAGFSGWLSIGRQLTAQSSRGSAFYLRTQYHHDNSVRHGKQVRRSGHAGILKLSRQPLIEINFDAFDQRVEAFYQSGIDGAQDVRVRANVLEKCVEHYAVTPTPSMLAPVRFYCGVPAKRRASLSNRISCRSCAGVDSKPKRR